MSESINTRQREIGAFQMKKTDYIMRMNENIKEELVKPDDYELPEFTKEVPISSKKSTEGESTIIDYDWPEVKSPSIKIKKIEFRNGEDLTNMFRINARDGADSIAFQYNGNTYVLRKTVKEIAQAIYNAYGRIKGIVEHIIGYLRTVAGSDYTISKIETDTWTFDKRIAKGGINFVDVEKLDGSNKAKLIEMITEKISELHLNSLIIGRFSLNNILLEKDSLKLTDLRRLRVSRRRSFVIDEFKSIMQYLYAIGIASKEEIYVSVATYTGANEKSCNEWYEQKTGKKSLDQIDIVDQIEEEIYC